MKFIPELKLNGSAIPRLLAQFRANVVGQLVTQVGYVEIGGEPYPALMEVGRHRSATSSATSRSLVTSASPNSPR